MRQYKHLFFDLDRTLYDFDANNRDTLSRLFREFNFSDNGKVDFDTFMDVYRPINLALWERYKRKEISKETLNLRRFADTLKACGLNEEVAGDFAGKYLEISPSQNRLLPGTVTTLQYLSESYDLHIITNGFEEVQYPKMARCGLMPFFRHIITSEKAGAQKPAPEIFEYALNLTGASPENSLMIGDDPVADIEGAFRQGMDQVWLSANDEVCTITPTYRIAALKELMSIL